MGALLKILSISMLLSTVITAPALANKDGCKFSGQVKQVGRAQSACVMINGKLTFFSYPKRAITALSEYEKTKLKAYNEIKKLSAKSVSKNISLKYKTSKFLTPSLEKYYVAQHEQASSFYEQFIKTPLTVNVYLLTERDKEFIKSDPIFNKRDSYKVFDRWFIDWSQGRGQENNLGYTAYFLEHAGVKAGHTGVVTYSKATKQTQRLYAQQVIAHEYFHVIQDFNKQKRDALGYESREQFELYYIPIFREGLANTVATGIAMENFEDYLLWYQVYLTEKKGEFSQAIFKEISTKQKTISVLKKIQTASGDVDAREASYSVGSLIFEWVIATYGIEVIKKLIFNQEVGNSFEDNLKLSTGLSLNQLYERASSHVLAGFTQAFR